MGYATLRWNDTQLLPCALGCDVYYSAVTPQLGDTEWADG